MAVSTCSEGSSILSAGSAVSDTEQHSGVQQMQQCFTTMSSSICFVCAQPQCWQPRSSALQLYSMLGHVHLSSSLHPEPAASMTPFTRHMACMCTRQAFHCQDVTPCKEAIHCLAGVQVQAAQSS